MEISLENLQEVFRGSLKVRFVVNNGDLIPSNNGDVHENVAQNRLRILSLFFAIIPMIPVTQKKGI